MSDYTKTTDFTAKDSLLTGNPSKIVRGSEIDDEFDNIATAIATKADVAGDTITGATITGASISTTTLTNPTLVTGALDTNGNELFTVFQDTSPVNHFRIGNRQTGSGPTLAAIGDDTDVDMLLTAQGAGVVKADGVEVATISGTQTLTNKELTTPKIAQINDTNGNEQLVFTVAGSAVNYPVLSNSANGNAVSLSAAGSDTNIDLNLIAKGAGTVQIEGVDAVTTSGSQTLTNKTLVSPTLTTPKVNTSINDSSSNELIKLTSTASAVNEVGITNAATTNAPEIAATGSDTNIDLDIAAKGTGEINLNSIMTSTVQPAFHATVSTDNNQSFTQATWTKVEFGTETYDQGGDYDSVTTHQFTAPSAGIYYVTAQVRTGVDPNGAGTTGAHAISITKNTGTTPETVLQYNDVNKNLYMMPLFGAIQLSSGDTLEVKYLHPVGSATNTIVDGTSAEQSTFFSVVKLF